MISKCSAPTARRLPTKASSNRPRKFWRAPTRRNGPTGRSCRWGLVADRLGDHDGAQTFYRGALKIAPGEPSVLSNLGLSYALTKQLPEAEAALREASASPRADARMRQNLALVLALEGKFAEAERISRQDMTSRRRAPMSPRSGKSSRRTIPGAICRPAPGQAEARQARRAGTARAAGRGGGRRRLRSARRKAGALRGKRGVALRARAA